MALVSTGYVMRVKIADLTGQIVTKTFDFNSTPTTIGAALTAGQSALAAIAGVTQGEIVGYSVSEEYREDTVIYGLGDKNDKVIITAPIDGVTGKSANLYINAPDPGIFVNDAAAGPEAEKLDAADTAVVAFVDLFRATGGTFLVSDGEQLSDTGVARGYKL